MIMNKAKMKLLQFDAQDVIATSSKLVGAWVSSYFTTAFNNYFKGGWGLDEIKNYRNSDCGDYLIAGWDRDGDSNYYAITGATVEYEAITFIGTTSTSSKPNNLKDFSTQEELLLPAVFYWLLDNGLVTTS